MIRISQDWLTSSVIATLLACIINIIFISLYRIIDENKKKRATLYYPLLFACKGFIRAAQNNGELDEVHLSHLFKSAAVMLNDIIYKNGSIIYLEDNDLDRFEELIDSVNENIGFLILLQKIGLFYKTSEEHHKWDTYIL